MLLTQEVAVGTLSSCSIQVIVQFSRFKVKNAERQMEVERYYSKSFIAFRIFIFSFSVQRGSFLQSLPAFRQYQLPAYPKAPA